ncbi:MAG: hypothetical protein AB4372_25030 [Xenococcus sp. (in: cyanobacteria)]
MEKSDNFYALLIGIDKYERNPNFGNLRGCVPHINLVDEHLCNTLKVEPIVIKAKTNPDETDFGALKGHIECVSDHRPDVTLNFTKKDDDWMINTEELSLEPGLYHLKVTTEKTGVDAPNPVKNLFEVADINI